MSCATEASSVVTFHDSTALTVQMLALIAVNRKDADWGRFERHALARAIGWREPGCDEGGLVAAGNTRELLTAG